MTTHEFRIPLERGLPLRTKGGEPIKDEDCGGNSRNPAVKDLAGQAVEVAIMRYGFQGAKGGCL
ncbi:predicted protein [Chaetomium globosum CBS 148.51]|uniref:Uncharacterized protein n=1 Tax=Chaetomium globosum (strain ATCC 6205 / CBS 148.51 / DSM 1962 / NBRC 6347 / NRRL 1970) TaxID=306901 RepID=Q2GLY8_CHAGB|nr:uncharacterized protein CHGG_11068 [Chaetomium globosum CBS 148.51]EAQ82892.1 predicted protein [Chaetomium globosum CBS 148.51]